MHHTLLHRFKDENSSKSTTPDESSTCAAVRHKETLQKVSSVFLNVVPVKVSYKGKEACTYAFLDQGSTASFCENSLVKELGINGTPRRLNLQTLSAPQTLDTVSFHLTVKALGETGEPRFLPDVIAVDEIPVKPNKTPDIIDSDKLEYLNGVSIPQLQNGTVKILIGANVPEAFRVESN